MNESQGQRNFGFTITELLIVIVVIGVLASITIVAYNGVQNRANDVAIQSNLSAMAEQLTLSNASSNVYPFDEATVSVIGFKVSKGSYGNHLLDSGMLYNLLYCSTIAGYSPANFAIIARSKSGNVYAVSGDNTQVRLLPTSSWTTGWGTMCPALLNVVTGNSSTGVWLYENSIWKIWL